MIIYHKGLLSDNIKEVYIMQIRGLQKTTLLDYPGYVASSIFLGGCNFRCPFCHNMELAANPVSIPQISEQEVLSFLESRRGILDGICITGGEPTLSLDLIPFMQKVKSLGYLIKLDTNGYLPNVIKDMVHMHLLDYIAMDIKSSPSGYSMAAGLHTIDMNQIEKSIQLIMQCGLPYEFRTTVIKEYHDDTVMLDIGKLINGASSYYLQSFKDSEQVSDHNLHACTKEELLHFTQILTPYIKNVSLRGIS